MSEKQRILTRRSMLAAFAGAALAGARSAEADVQQATASNALADGKKTDAPVVETRTLVCIYLLGGSDGNSLVAPLGSQYGAWSSARGELSLREDALLPVRTRSGMEYGLNPQLVELQRYMKEGSAAVVANVGASARPAGEDRYGSLAFLQDGYLTPDWAARKAGAGLNTDVAFTFNNGVSMVPIGKTRFEGERRKNPALMEKIAAASFRASFPDTIAGRQMGNVAGLLKAGNISGATGQVILCPVGGFGATSSEMIMTEPLYRQLSAAMAALYQATVEMGVSKQVTIYTDSEYGRTLRPNGNHGSDPGWGNHHFVLGGAVLGGDVYGKYPDMVSGPFDSDSALIPTTSNEQYHATLAAWIGIAPSELPAILPGLSGSTPGFLPA